MQKQLEEILLEFSEWLDGEGLMRGEDEKPDDKRTHEQLVDDFIESHAENSGQVYEQLVIEVDGEPGPVRVTYVDGDTI